MGPVLSLRRGIGAGATPNRIGMPLGPPRVVLATFAIRLGAVAFARMVEALAGLMIKPFATLVTL